MMSSDAAGPMKQSTTVQFVGFNIQITDYSFISSILHFFVELLKAVRGCSMAGRRMHLEWTLVIGSDFPIKLHIVSVCKSQTRHEEEDLNDPAQTLSTLCFRTPPLVPVLFWKDFGLLPAFVSCLISSAGFIPSPAASVWPCLFK